jgi:micrococcal nuclease
VPHRGRAVRFAAFVSTIVIAVGASACGGTAPAIGPSSIVSVVDGDTVVVRLDGRDENVRLIGIDTPETKHPTKPVQCLGPEATDFLTGLLPTGTPVRLERDVEGRDRYGRLLAYVYRSEDGLFVNLEIARQGFARPLVIEPNVAHAGDVAEATQAAQAAGRGLWSACVDEGSQ